MPDELTGAKTNLGVWRTPHPTKERLAHGTLRAAGPTLGSAAIPLPFVGLVGDRRGVQKHSFLYYFITPRLLTLGWARMARRGGRFSRYVRPYSFSEDDESVPSPSMMIFTVVGCVWLASEVGSGWPCCPGRPGAGIERPPPLPPNRPPPRPPRIPPIARAPALPGLGPGLTSSPRTWRERCLYHSRI